MTVIIVICVYLKENIKNLKRMVFRGNQMNSQDRDYESEMINKEIYGGNVPENIVLHQGDDDMDDDLRGK